MANMVDMAQSAEEASESMVGGATPYPYGLCITLDEDSLGKLGFSEPPPVGTVLTIQAVVKVSAASEYQSIGLDGAPGEVESSSSWQITAMGMMAGQGDAAASGLYDD